MRLVKPCIPCGIVGISIHAPQWGATYRRAGGRRAGQISIHAPQWGATCQRLYRLAAHIDFNPRTPVGCDAAGAEVRGLVRISIHAPQWGATLDGIFNAAVKVKFQSTHPSGVRLHATCGECTVLSFQSTHPSGVRRDTFAETRKNVWISIHAPQWGATIRAPQARPRPRFQSTHPSGVRPMLSLRSSMP